MMHEILQYRGITLFYDDERDSFVYDKDDTNVRQTILDVKKSIDNYITINSKFLPFKAFKKYYVDGDSFIEINVISILPNGSLVFTDESDYTKTLDISKRNLLFNADAEVTNTLIVAKNTFESAKTAYYATIINVTDNLVQMDLSHL